MTDGDWRDGGFRRRRPSGETLAWVAATLGPGSRVVGCRRLTGGVCSAVHRLTVERRGVRTFVVLRQYPGGLGLRGILEKEILNLGVVAGSGLPVPRILAADVAGVSTAGAPSLLMTRLPGHVDLSPAEPRSWMTRIAEMAVLLHSLDLPAKAFRPWTDSWIAPRDGFRVPVDARKPPAWAEQLRSLYESIAGVTLDPWWDLYALLHYDDSGPKWIRGQVAGRRPVDVPGMTARVEVAVETALRRLG
jgi:phosphotransferase family enzyme